MQAQLSISALNSTYTQNFDGMGTGDLTLTDDITGSIPGFHAFRQVGNTNPNQVFADYGLENFAGYRNYGPDSNFDRALGMLPGPATGYMRIGVRFVNNTGVPVNAIQVSYTGEQWHDGGNGVAQTLVFAYRKSTNVNDLTTGTYTAVPSLAFTTPTVGPSSTSLDGNAPANRSLRTGTFPVTLLPGEEIMLRWEDTEASGENHGVAIDDLSVTALGSSTAAAANIGGRIANASGRGLANVRVVLSGGNLGEPRYAFTNPFGYYRFEDVTAGQTYVLGVMAKRYRFTNPVRVLNLGEDLADVDFIAQ